VSSLVPKSAIARALGEEATRRVQIRAAHCEGFWVWTAAGKLGVVEKVLVDTWDEPRELVVRTGLFRLRRVAVPVGAITAIDLRRRRMFMDESAVQGTAGFSRVDRWRYGVVG
jgi:PRC-barrel domain